MSFPNPDNYGRGCDCSSTELAPVPDDLYKTIPAPIVHIGKATLPIPSSLYVSYIPNNMRPAWLTTNTEVWLFAYKKQKKKQPPLIRKGGFKHPVDTTKTPRNSAVYGGQGGGISNLTYHTEFAFLVGGEIPDPYEHVPLSNFNVYEFYKTQDPIETTPGRQVAISDFPFSNPSGNAYDDKGFYNFYGYGSCLQSASWTVKFQFRFVIPNPTTSSSKFPKIMGPPSPIISAHAVYDCSSTPAEITGVRLTT